MANTDLSLGLTSPTGTSTVLITQNVLGNCLQNVFKSSLFFFVRE